MPLTPEQEQELAELEKKYGNSVDASGKVVVPAGTNTDFPTTQEMHPAVTTGTRLLIKNLANSPESAMGYIKQEYPGMEVRVGKTSGQLEMKYPDEREWKVLDPQTGAFGADTLRDIGDVGYDTVAGLGSGAAATLGGVAGGIPGAAAAGGASSAALEGLRQKLGQYLGLPQEVSGEDVAVQGGIGAVMPAALGTGATKSLLAEGAKKAAPAVMAGLSGVPEQVIKAYTKNAPQVDELAREGVSDYISKVHDTMKAGVAQAKKQVGKELQETIEASQTPVNIGPVKAKLDNLISDLENKSIKNASDIENLNALKQKRDELFSKVVPDSDTMLIGTEDAPMVAGGRQLPLPDYVSAKEAFELQEKLNSEAAFSPRQSFGPRNATEEKSVQRWQNANAEASRELNKGLDKATDGWSGELKGKYKQYSRLQQDLNTHFKDENATYKTLSNVYGKNKKLLQERLDEIDALTGGELGVKKAADNMAALSYFEDPNLLPSSGGGTTSTSRSLGGKTLGAAIGAYLAKTQGQNPYIGAAAGGVAGGMAFGPKALKQYIKAYRGGKSLTDKIPATLKQEEPYKLIQQYIRNQSEDEQND